MSGEGEWQPVKHHPFLASTGRHGCWGSCSCGEWKSGTYTTVTGVHYAFGQHLVEVTGVEVAP